MVNINRDGYVMSPLNPKKEGICDYCGGKLIIRPDDTKEVSAQLLNHFPKIKVIEKRM